MTRPTKNPGAERPADVIARMLRTWHARDLRLVMSRSTLDSIAMPSGAINDADPWRACVELGVEVVLHPLMEPGRMAVWGDDAAGFAIEVKPGATPRDPDQEARTREILERWDGLFRRLAANDGPTDVCPSCQFEARNGHSPACSGKGER